MSHAQGTLEFTPEISEPSIRQRLSLPRADPCHLFYFQYLALGTGSHFLPPRQQGDLDQSILIFTKEILFPLPRDAPPSFLNIVQIFFCLTLGLFYRVSNSRQPDDVMCCIRYLRYLHCQWNQASMNFLIPVRISLVQALAVQVELQLGDVDLDIEEMANLCDELLNSDIPVPFVAIPITDFARAIHVHLNDPLKWKICSNKVMDCLQKANLRLPGMHQVTMALSQSLYNRFIVAPSDDDYEEGITTLDSILTFRNSGGEPSPYRERALAWAALFADARFITYGKPEQLEHAIYRTRTMLDGTSIDDPQRASKLSRLSHLEKMHLMTQEIPETRCSFLPNLESFHPSANRSPHSPSRWLSSKIRRRHSRSTLMHFKYPISISLLI